MKGGKRISYSRIPVEEFFDENAKTKWVDLKADKAIGILSEDYRAGFIGIKLYIRDVTEGPLFGLDIADGPIFDTKLSPIWKPLRKNM